MVMVDIRASVCGKLNVVLVILVMVTILAVDLVTGKAVDIVVFVGKDVWFVVVVTGSASARAGLGRQIQVPVLVFAIQGSLVGVDGGKVIAGIDGRGGIGNQMVPEMSKGAFHGGGGCLKEQPKDGNLEMCPEAIVAGLYLTALAITRTGELFKELDRSWEK
jgi:hypothetical protein